MGMRGARGSREDNKEKKDRWRAGEMISYFNQATKFSSRHLLGNFPVFWANGSEEFAIRVVRVSRFVSVSPFSSVSLLRKTYFQSKNQLLKIWHGTCTILVYSWSFHKPAIDYKYGLHNRKQSEYRLQLESDSVALKLSCCNHCFLLFNPRPSHKKVGISFSKKSSCSAIIWHSVTTSFPLL